MSTSELFKMVKGAFQEADLLPASLIDSEEQLQHYQARTGKQLVLFEKVEALAPLLGCEAKDIYFSEKGFSSYFYYNFPVLIDISIMNAEAIRELSVAERIRQADASLHHALEKGLYSTFFTLIDSRIKIMAFNRLYEQIPVGERYERFISVYQKEDYGFEVFAPHVLDTVFDLQTDSYKSRLVEKLDTLSDNDILVIYRGTESESTSISNAYSWTADFSTALYFANRANTGTGDIYEAQVKKTDIIEYLTGRGESEIIVNPESLNSVKSLDMVHIQEELELLNESGKLDKYREHARAFDSSLFNHPDSIHGVSHMERVFVHCLSLSEQFNLSEADENILIQAALYHDIGLIHDEEDEEHGELSWVKAENAELIQENEEDTAIIRFLMEYHCIGDEKALNALQKRSDLDAVRTKKLFLLFKDADDLDRVRLGDLDARFLRHNESVRRIMFAEDLFQGHQ